MGLNVPKPLQKSISSVIPAMWATDTVRYLGITTNTSFDKMVKDNINPITAYMQEHCRMWEAYTFSWLGREAVVKMILFPKLLFVFLNAILDIQDVTLSKIPSIISKFIGGNGKPRIKLSTLEKGLPKGGASIPNINRYYNATMLTAYMDWWNMGECDVTLLLEQEGCDMKLTYWLVANSAAKKAFAHANLMVK